MLSTVFLAVCVYCWTGKDVQRGTGIKLSSGRNLNSTGSRGTGLKLNFAGRGGGRQTTIGPDNENFSSSVTSTPAPVIPLVEHEDGHHNTNLHVGLVVPYKSFGVREYTKAVTSAKAGLQRKLGRLFRKYDLQVHLSMKELTPSPTCKYLFCV